MYEIEHDQVASLTRVAHEHTIMHTIILALLCVCVVR